jgi:hypothetical protein
MEFSLRIGSRFRESTRLQRIRRVYIQHDQLTTQTGYIAVTEYM